MNSIYLLKKPAALDGLSGPPLSRGIDINQEGAVHNHLTAQGWAEEGEH